MILTKLPTELLVEILNHIDYTDIVNLSEVCKQFYDIVTNFSWDQLCVIETVSMPKNIQFTNYFLNLFILDNDIESFCLEQLLCSKPFKTVVITQPWTNQKFFYYLQSTECQNVVVADAVNIYDLHGSFNFYISNSLNILDLESNNRNSINYQKYDVDISTTIFKNSYNHSVIVKHLKSFFQCSCPYCNERQYMSQQRLIKFMEGITLRSNYDLPSTIINLNNDINLLNNSIKLIQNRKKSRHEKYINRSKHKQNSYPKSQYKRSNNLINNRTNARF